MKKLKKYTLFICLIFVNIQIISAQRQKVKNQPFADQKLFHLGFMVGINAEDLIISHTGNINDDKSTWFSEIPSYSVGLSVGIISDRYINQYMNLRVTPTLHLGERKFKFKEQNSGEEQDVSIKSNYLSLPIHMRFSAERLNNFRPYILAGGYVNYQIGAPKNPIIKYKDVDYGIEIGLGCNFYFPIFKLSPELKFSFGLRDLIEKDRSDLNDKDLLKYTNAINSGKSRMISLVFNFE